MWGVARLRSGFYSQSLRFLIILRGPKVSPEGRCCCSGFSRKGTRGIHQKASSRDEDLGQSPEPTRTGRRRKGESLGGQSMGGALTSLGRAGLLCRVWFTQASSQGQGEQGCHHFANKATEARKLKSLTQNHLAGEWPGQVVNPTTHFQSPQPRSQIYTSKVGQMPARDREAESEGWGTEGPSQPQSSPSCPCQGLINQLPWMPGQVYPFNSFSPQPVSFCS